MSNVPELTKFFLAGTWKGDLNRDNPLGMRGEIAESYAELISTMWKGKYSSTSPTKYVSSCSSVRMCLKNSPIFISPYTYMCDKCTYV